MAYASDVHTNRAKKDEEIGTLVGFNMIGMSGGGVVAILMENLNLFSPLLVAAAVDFCAFLLCLCAFLFCLCVSFKFVRVRVVGHRTKDQTYHTS